MERKGGEYWKEETEKNVVAGLLVGSQKVRSRQISRVETGIGK